MFHCSEPFFAVHARAWSAGWCLFECCFLERFPFFRAHFCPFGVRSLKSGLEGCVRRFLKIPDVLDESVSRVLLLLLPCLSCRRGLRSLVVRFVVVVGLVMRWLLWPFGGSIVVTGRFVDARAHDVLPAYGVYSWFRTCGRLSVFRSLVGSLLRCSCCFGPGFVLSLFVLRIVPRSRRSLVRVHTSLALMVVGPLLCSRLSCFKGHLMCTTSGCYLPCAIREWPPPFFYRGSRPLCRALDSRLIGAPPIVYYAGWPCRLILCAVVTALRSFGFPPFICLDCCSERLGWLLRFIFVFVVHVLWLSDLDLASGPLCTLPALDARVSTRVTRSDVYAK